MFDWKFLANRYLLKRRITSDGLSWDFSLTDCVETNEPFLDSIILKDGYNTFIDIGANVGAWSIRASEYYKKIYAFEPNKETFKHLEHNIKRNHCHNIDCRNYALSNIEGKTDQRMIPTRDSNIGFSSSIAETYRLDVFQLNPSLIKVDVEGNGYQTIEGAIHTIKINYPIIALEVHTESESKVPEILPDYSWDRYYRNAELDTWIWRENGKQLFLVGYPK